MVDIANNVYKEIYEYGTLRLKRNLYVKSYDFKDENFTKNFKKFDFNEEQ